MIAFLPLQEQGHPTVSLLLICRKLPVSYDSTHYLPVSFTWLPLKSKTTLHQYLLDLLISLYSLSGMSSFTNHVPSHLHFIQLKYLVNFIHLMNVFRSQALESIRIHLTAKDFI